MSQTNCNPKKKGIKGKCEKYPASLATCKT